MVEKPEISYDDFYRVDLRVARVVWARRVDGAERLLKLTLDVGKLGQRTVVEGLRPLYEPTDLVGKKVVYIANVKPRKIRGIWSEGRLLAVAFQKNGMGEPELVTISPTKKVTAGTIVR